MAPTEYRVIAARTTLRALPDLRLMVAAGEALNPEVLHVWREATGIEIRDGYGQTETGQMTGIAHDEPVRPGSMGRALPGVSLWVQDGELIADPLTVPTFFLGYLGEGVERGGGAPGRRRDTDRGHRRCTYRGHRRDTDRRGGAEPRGGAARGGGSERGGGGGWRIEDRREGGAWHTGDLVRMDEDGYLWFEGRSDDVIVSAGYRIGPFEVESALVAHPAVAEAAAVAAPDEERGSVVRAVVVLRDGRDPSPALARELQEHVKRETAPYKYPRIVEFARALPKTASGKVKRAQLRAGARR
jgi:acetyl-CoA synthetase